MSPPPYSAGLQTDSHTLSISQSATLSIIMTIRTEAKANKRTKYRPVQRPDGVIVLQRPYRPATSSLSPQVPMFEKHTPTFILPASTAKRNQGPTMNRVGQDLAGIGGNLMDTKIDGCFNMEGAGRAGYHNMMEAGQGGYNDHCGRYERASKFTEELRQHQTECRRTPTRRFLSEAGPWSAFESRIT
jgi:hypothetical protein